jgi:NAD(P)-dependent dehydrogenase (short-subunit alcohol dehydrogenase family)
MGQLEGRVAIVTGAGLGIGQAIARRFVEEGARVVVAELNPETGKATAEQLGASAHFVQTNAARKADVEAMVAATVAKWGTLETSSSTTPGAAAASGGSRRRPPS